LQEGTHPANPNDPVSLANDPGTLARAFPALQYSFLRASITRGGSPPPPKPSPPPGGRAAPSRGRSLAAASPVLSCLRPRRRDRGGGAGQSGGGADLDQNQPPPASKNSATSRVRCVHWRRGCRSRSLNFTASEPRRSNQAVRVGEEASGQRGYFPSNSQATGVCTPSGIYMVTPVIETIGLR